MKEIVLSAITIESVPRARGSKDALKVDEYSDLLIQKRVCYELVRRLPPRSRSQVSGALKAAEGWHAGQLRGWTKYPYITHVYHVVSLLTTEMGVRDPVVLSAGALHDVVEDCNVAVEDLKIKFGERVASIVESESENLFDGRERYMEHFAKAPKRTLLVKMADRIDNLRFVALEGVSAFKKGASPEEAVWPMELVAKYVFEAEIYILPYARKASAAGYDKLDKLIRMFKKDQSFARTYRILLDSGKTVFD